MIETTLTDQEYEKIGQEIVKLFSLPKKRSNGRYNTSWGDKTLLGLGMTIERIYLERVNKNDSMG